MLVQQQLTREWECGFCSPLILAPWQQLPAAAAAASKALPEVSSPASCTATAGLVQPLSALLAPPLPLPQLPLARAQEPHIRQASLFSRLHTIAASRRSSSISASSDRTMLRPFACRI